MPYAKMRALVPLAIVLVFSCGCKNQEVAIEGLNINNEGNAFTVLVYELTSRANFHDTLIENFWRDPDTALDDEKVRRVDQLTLYPNADAEVILPFTLQEETQYLAVAANLRDPEDDEWRWSETAKAVKGKMIRIRVNSNRLSVEIAKR